ncbi:AraC-like ligand-binding domain-containing protein [Mycobacterium saskatchewanense]|nr:helix-turn-helix domain-containing protein [Mycobacterium saskatchewanense]
MSREDRVRKGHELATRRLEVDVADGPPTAAAGQFEAFDRFISERLVPMRLSTDDTEGFRARARSVSLGDVRLSDLWARGPFVARRTVQLITAGCPEYLKVGLQLSGVAGISQGSREAELRPGDIVLYDTSRPYQISTAASFRMQTVMLSRGALRLSPAQLEQLPLRPISCRQGLGLLVSQYLRGLNRQLDAGLHPASCHLADALVDLLAALFVEELASASRAPTESDNGRAGLLNRVRAHIESRLADPHLNVASIARSHYISVRYLQKLFEEQGDTVTGWIRAQRLEHCRRDLANPDLAAHSIGSIAANWGLVDQPHFSRLFKSAYGMCPRDYRGREIGVFAA